MRITTLAMNGYVHITGNKTSKIRDITVNLIRGAGTSQGCPYPPPPSEGL